MCILLFKRLRKLIERSVQLTSSTLSSASVHRRRKGLVVGGHHGECGARAYNGGLGAEPPAGSKGRAPGHGGQGGVAP